MPGLLRVGGWSEYLTWGSSRLATISRDQMSRAPTRVPTADVAVLIVRPGPTADRSDSSRGAEGNRTGRACFAGRRRSRASRRGRIAVDARRGGDGSPHGGSWLGLLADRGLPSADRGEQPDVIIDCFGLMHAADQRRALAERAARLTPGGVLLLQFHALSTIIRCRQWSALRHGHYAYYSTTALTTMLAAVGFSPCTAWQFDLYQGTALLSAKRVLDEGGEPDDVICSHLADDARAGVRDPGTFADLQHAVQAHATALQAGWRPSDPREARLSAMAPHPGRSPSCARRRLIADSYWQWSMPRRPSRACGCQERTSRWPPPPNSPYADRTRYCCSSLTCWPRSGTRSRKSKPPATGGWMSSRSAHEAAVSACYQHSHRPHRDLETIQRVSQPPLCQMIRYDLAVIRP